MRRAAANLFSLPHGQHFVNAAGPRQMQLAAREEDYGLASRLRDQMAPLTAALHPMRQYQWGRVQALHGAGSKRERLDAISALGELWLLSRCCIGARHALSMCMDDTQIGDERRQRTNIG